jgi:hypothetical protein
MTRLRKFNIPRWAPWLALPALMWWVKFAAAPVRDLVIDDWFFFVTADNAENGLLLLSDGIRDIFRPVYAAVLFSAFLFTHGDPMLLSVIGWLLAVIMIVVFLWAACQLGGRHVALWAGLICVFIPITDQPYYWHCHAILLYIPTLYLASFGAWIRYLKAGRPIYRISASLLYLVAVFSYEYGVALVPLYPGLAWLMRGRPSASWPFLFCAFLYLTWRFTGGFGLGVATLADPTYFSGTRLSLGDIILNARTLASWWAGYLAAGSIASPWVQTLAHPPKWTLLFLAGSGLLAGVVLLGIRQQSSGIAREVQLRGGALGGMAFGLCWMLCAYAPFLLFPAAARHNLFPSFGFALFAGYWLADKRVAWQVLLLALVILGGAAQGTALAWLESGRLHRAAYERLEHEKSLWADADVIVVDTRLLRERVTPGLLTAPSSHPRNWERYANASLPRGFVFRSMVQRVVKQAGFTHTPKVIMDVESGVRWDGGLLYWHERFNPEKTFSMPAGNVYVLDIIDAYRFPAFTTLGVGQVTSSTPSRMRSTASTPCITE